MPRAGLAPATVTEVAADVADEIHPVPLSMGAVAERLGVKTPSLYKHVDGLADLNHRIAILGATELGDTLRNSMQGLAGGDALAAATRALRSFIGDHPGRYAATVGVVPSGPDDPLAVAMERALDSFTAVLRGYDLEPDQRIPATRMLRSVLHGFATLEASNGFQLDTDIDSSFDWIVAFIDRGLRAAGS